MVSQLDSFLSQCRDDSNVVIGTESMTLSGGVVLTGVWSSLTVTTESEYGGEQRVVTVSVIVPASASITKALIGQRGTYGGIGLRVSNVEIGTNESTVYFNDQTEGIKL